MLTLKVNSSSYTNPTLTLSSAIPFSRPPLQNWISAGIKKVGDLYDQHQLRTFQHISDLYNIPNKDFFIYLRYSHILSSPSCFQAPLTKDIITFLNSTSYKICGISHIYNVLSKPKMGNYPANSGSPICMVACISLLIPVL